MRFDSNSEYYEVLSGLLVTRLVEFITALILNLSTTSRPMVNAERGFGNVDRGTLMLLFPALSWASAAITTLSASSGRLMTSIRFRIQMLTKTVGLAPAEAASRQG
jgi:hypothetical protein